MIDRRVRVINFTDIELAGLPVLTTSAAGGEALIAELRLYVDLPTVFVVRHTDGDTIAPVLAALREIRSPAYPHAIFVLDGEISVPDGSRIDSIECNTEDPGKLLQRISDFIDEAFDFDESRLEVKNDNEFPDSVDVLIVGAGVVGLYAANLMRERGLSFCVVEQQKVVGGIWSSYANETSQVNTSEGAYRLIEPTVRANRDHSSTAEILGDLARLAAGVSDSLFTETTVDSVEKLDTGGYRSTVRLEARGVSKEITSTGVILAINDRVGAPREISWANDVQFQGQIVDGTSNGTKGVDWAGKRVVVVGMGAFATEAARTALEGGAEHVTVVCRRHGTVCPKIIDYFNFSSPYNEKFDHDRKGNMRNMMLWKRLYEQSGATEPECWMGKIKHTGHTISVSDIWFIAHHLGKLDTITGSISSLNDRGVEVAGGIRIEADIVVNCVGFHRNTSAATAITGYTEMYNNNYIDKDLMYLADAYIDDDVFNSFFGSSVLEMAKFFLEVYLEFYSNPEYETMTQIDGIEKIPVDDRSWSHYIAATDALMVAYPKFYDVAKTQIEKRTANFHEMHDLEAFIAENKREWIDTHTLLAGRELPEEERLPYVFEKLVARSIS